MDSPSKSGIDAELHNVMVEATKRHALTPGESFAAYREAKYILLNRFVAERQMVYLDMNFWISLRNPTDARKPKESAHLLDILRGGVESGRILCPVSYVVYVELMKQKQAGDGRMNLARLMDELSMGVGIRNFFDVGQIEYLSFFSQRVPRLAGYIDSVWAPIGHVVHEVYPYQDELPHELMEQGRKVMCDVQWAMKMEHLAKKDLPEFARTAAEKINEARKIYLRGNKTFAQLFADELDGTLERVVPHIEEILDQMKCAGFASTEIEIIEKQRITAAGDLRRAVLTPDSEAIPSQRIEAALHAAMRMDDNRPFKQNDLDDFRHASVAAAYCDFFLCDGPLAHLLANPAVKKMIPKRCTIVSSMESAIRILSSLVNTSSD